jgi:uncharacterized DUF497 family protein
MQFEFDPAKSAANLEKHGIDFVTAQALWDDPDGQMGDALDRGERREILFAQLQRKIWAAVFIRRGANIRIISVRRARTREVEVYEQSKFQTRPDA